MKELSAFHHHSPHRQCQAQSDSLKKYTLLRYQRMYPKLAVQSRDQKTHWSSGLGGRDKNSINPYAIIIILSQNLFGDSEIK